MNRKISLGAALAFVIIAAAVAVCITMLVSRDTFNRKISNVEQQEQMYQKIQKIDQVVSDNSLYDVDSETLLNAIGQGVVSGIGDPYAEYYSSSEYQKLLDEQSGDAVGIGVLLQEDSSGDYAAVVQVYPDSPAESAGLQPGDLILEVDGSSVRGMELEEVSDVLIGEKGTAVSLVYRRNGSDSTAEITRRQYSQSSVTYQVVDGDIGYLRISSFEENTPSQLNDALNNLQAQQVRGLVLDVRNNAGGDTGSCTECLDQLLPEGVLGYTRTGSSQRQILATSDDSEIDLPMAVLVNENTSSMAELFAVAIGDYDKGDLVGTTTYGKGVLQTLYPLDDGSAVRITTAYFDPPASENFDGVGLTPDYEVSLGRDQLATMGSMDGDDQLEKAVSVLRSSWL